MAQNRPPSGSSDFVTESTYGHGPLVGRTVQTTPSATQVDMVQASAHGERRTANEEVDSRRKRRRTSETIARITVRQSHAATSLEVDHMILEYLLYNAVHACLDTGRSQESSQQVALCLEQVDDLLRVFQIRHPTFSFDTQLRFRLLLLKFTTLLTQRFQPSSHTPSLESLSRLRQHNQIRARLWIGHAERLPSWNHAVEAYEQQLPFSERLVIRARSTVIRSHRPLAPFATWPHYHLENENGQSGADADDIDDAHFYGSPRAPALLDIIPLFMQISAMMHFLLPVQPGAPPAVPTSQWKVLAAEFLMQACLEQYLVCGASGTDAIDEAFAWGYCSMNADGTIFETSTQNVSPGESDYSERERQRDDMVNVMFLSEVLANEHGDQMDEEERKEGDEAAREPTWPEIRDAALSRLFPAPSSLPLATPMSSPPASIHSSSPPRADLSPSTPTATNSLHAHLHHLAQECPLARHYSDVIGYCTQLADAIPLPVLVQLETGRLDGMTERETSEFLTSCGLQSDEFQA